MNALDIDYTPELLAVILGIGGAIAIILAMLYVRDKNSIIYKLMVLGGLITGICLAVVCFTTYGIMETYTTVIVAVAAFTLIIRPFREIHFALLFSLLVMVIVYILLGTLQGGTFDVLGTGWGRVIIAVVAGAIVFMLTNFIESLIKMVGKLLNWWPILMLLGAVCLMEAIAVYSGHSSIINWLNAGTGA